MEKKNLKRAALKHEISTNIGSVIDVLERLKIIKPSKFFIDSMAYDWLDNEPNENDMDNVLKALGY